MKFGRVGGNLLYCLVVTAVFMSAAHAQGGTPALPERDCGPLDQYGRCSGSGGGSSSSVRDIQRQSCQAICDSQFTQCTIVSHGSAAGGDCSQRQSACRDRGEVLVRVSEEALGEYFQ